MKTTKHLKREGIEVMSNNTDPLRKELIEQHKIYRARDIKKCEKCGKWNDGTYKMADCLLYSGLCQECLKIKIKNQLKDLF